MKIDANTVLWPGIRLTRLNTVHWLLYFPAVLFAIAAVTAICSGLIVSRTLFRNKAGSD